MTHTARCGRTDPHGGHAIQRPLTGRPAFCAGNVAIVEAVTAEDDAAPVYDDCHLYPDPHEETDHARPPVYPEDDETTSPEHPIEGGY